MPTLLSGSVDLTSMERYYTVEDLSLVSGETVKAIYKLRDAGIIAPCLFKGRHQYDRGALLRLEALRALQLEFGHNSALPARIVKEAGPKLDALGSGPEVFTADAHAALVAGIMAAVWTPEVQAELERRFLNLAGERR